MNMLSQFFESLPLSLRILAVAVFAVAAHFAVRAVKLIAERVMTLRFGRDVKVEETFARKFPKTATLVTILVSSITFAIYFIAVGIVVREFNVSLTAYLASASVIGLAIGFGTQGFVQDVVSGLTLIFSDALNVENVVEISGQVGRVEKIGLRFTTIIDIRGQRVFLPNRSIGIINQSRRDVVRAYVDVQVPDGMEADTARTALATVANGMHSQHKAVILRKPEIFGIFTVENGEWRYIRIKFALWPGQESMIEKYVKPRIVQMMKGHFPDYAEWMVVVTLRVD